MTLENLQFIELNGVKQLTLVETTVKSEKFPIEKPLFWIVLSLGTKASHLVPRDGKMKTHVRGGKRSKTIDA